MRGIQSRVGLGSEGTSSLEHPLSVFTLSAALSSRRQSALTLSRITAISTNYGSARS
jgi:hypothetical protein